MVPLRERLCYVCMYQENVTLKKIVLDDLFQVEMFIWAIRFLQKA